MSRPNTKLPPTLRSYPGMELAGLDLGAPPARGNLGALPGVDMIGDQVKAYLAARFQSDIAPMIRNEAAAAAEASLKPLIIGVAALSGTALVVSLLALAKAKK